MKLEPSRERTAPARPLARRVGRGLLLAGLALIGTWAFLHFSSRWIGQREVARFEQRADAVARDSAPDHSPAPSIDPAAPAGAEPVEPPEPPGLPDQARWAPGRIEEYRHAIENEHRSPIAVLRVPAGDIVVPVFDGADEWALTVGAGRIPGTGRPGEGGNLGIAGHRDGFFRGLEGVAIGDAVELRTMTSTESYVVRSIEIVDPDDTHVLEPTDRPSITLVTCYPFYFVGDAPKRFIVRAERPAVAVGSGVAAGR